ncbi:MAG TPA: ATP-binding protein [Polyangiaceae bacterium]|nr:ATP-binding protein [Polyangiaceae bacterium]
MAHQLEVSARRASAIGRLAREQYIHEAHTVLLRDASHAEHHDAYVATFERELEALRPDVDAEGRADLDAIAAESKRLASLYANEMLPAMNEGDTARLRRANHDADHAVDHMTARADRVADTFAHRAMESERAVERMTAWLVFAAVGTGLAATALAAAIARGLWAALVRPLNALRDAAERVAGGDVGARVEPLAAEELAVVGGAINGMLDALARAERQLLAAERFAAIGRVAAGVAHEINNPIGIIRGYVKTIREDTTDPELRKEMDILDEEASACQRIAEDLLTFARAPALSPRETDARALVEDALARTLGAGAAGGAEVVSSVEAAPLCVDPVRVRQVLTNLVRNALQTGSARKVEIRGRRAGHDRYRFEVLDDGPGVTDEVRERLFEPFFTTRREGAGLGLAVCYGLVVAHGGRIHAENRPAGGLAVTVELPTRPVTHDGGGSAP